jgi:uncharacterized protein YhaN
MRQHLKLLAISGACIVFASCAVTPEECDPHNQSASVVNKFNCSSQGVYTQRVEEKEKILLDEQKANEMFREVYVALAQEQALVSRDIETQRKAMDYLNRAMAPLLAELKAKSAGNTEIQSEVAALEAELSSMNQVENPAVLQRQHEIQRLREQLAQLESDLGLSQ